MTKVVEAYCTLHWKAEPQERVLAAHADLELSWAGQAVTLDLCAKHKREVDHGKHPLPDLLALGDPVPPAALTKRRRVQGPGTVEDRHYKTPDGGWQQPAGRTAEAIRAWTREHNIMARDEPPRLAFANKQGHGNYFPIWLLQAYDERDQAKEPAA
jgi:hypothetical protein